MIKEVAEFINIKNELSSFYDNEISIEISK